MHQVFDSILIRSLVIRCNESGNMTSIKMRRTNVRSMERRNFANKVEAEGRVMRRFLLKARNDNRKITRLRRRKFTHPCLDFGLSGSELVHV